MLVRLLRYVGPGPRSSLKVQILLVRGEDKQTLKTCNRQTEF